MKKAQGFSRREKEMMDIIYRLGRATAAEVRGLLAAPPSYSSVRGTLRVLEQKGHLQHEYDGNRYVYKPTMKRERARQTALNHLMTTFYEGSAAAVVAALLEDRGSSLTQEDLDELSELIAQARQSGR